MSTPKTNSPLSNLQLVDKEVAISLEKLIDSVVMEVTAHRSALQPQQAKKMSTPKTNSPLSNLQLVDKEVAISLEKLIDSVVMEVTAHRSALQPQQVNEPNDDALGINSLPDEIIEGVFGYLTQNQLGQIARVCRRWNVLTKSRVLWKKVNVKLFPSHRNEYTVAESFINRLPSCATSISLIFTENTSLDFEELCVKLQKKCPHLEELMLTNSRLSNSLSAVIDLCTQLLQDVKNLIFYYSQFGCHHSTVERIRISKIEILKLMDCYIDCSNQPPFSKMPHLKQLSLYYTMVHGSLFKNDTSFLNQLHVLNLGHASITAWIFPAIQNHGHNLEDLYLCFMYHDLTFTDSVFPHLKTICLSRTGVTCEDLVSLIQSCPSLENVYVDECVAESFAAHPFVVTNRSKSGIVKAIGWNHNHNVDY